MKNAFEASGSSPTSAVNLQPSPDILIENYNSVFLLRPATPAGQSWLQENVIGEETQLFGNAVVCEPRYLSSLILGARGDGIVVRS